MLPSAEGSLMEGEINRGYLDHIRRWSGKRPKLSYGAIKRKLLFNNLLRLLLLPFLLLTGPLFIISLRASLRRKTNSRESLLHQQALAYPESFVDQYPLHLYPLVAKALELAYLKKRLAGLLDEQMKVVEVAIGEGTLSARLFKPEPRVTALDLNPYSLVKALKLGHVDRAIVCDGLHPPLQKGSYDLLISNNFLHHVTQKESAIASWSQVAGRILFNENTPFWASGWTVPYLLKKIGLDGPAARRARKIKAHSIQHLESKSALEQLVRKYGEIEDQASFMSERTFFYCSLFSFFMRCYGPPTPPLLKKAFLGPLRLLIIPMTIKLAELLISFDAYQDRATDTFVFFSYKSKLFRPMTKDQGLLCPRCEGSLNSEHRCERCGTAYSFKDGMLFLLPEEFDYIAREYSSEVAASIPAEHL
jgi:ubiquinone/menaquinone biosynthesis C-methylase UbiE